MVENKNIKIRKAKKHELKRCQIIVYSCIDFVRVSKNLKKRLFEAYTMENIEKAWKEVGIYISEKHGFIRGTGRLDKSGEIRMIYVDPDFHRLGFGKAMVRKIESLAKRRGYRKVYLHALPPAKGFYKKLGYRKKGFRKKGMYYMEKEFE